MYISKVPNRNSPPAILLREGYREGGKVKTRTLQNLTHWPPARIDMLKRVLKGEFDENPPADSGVRLGKAVGAIFVLNDIARRIGLSKVLGKDRRGKLALILAMARIMAQGSRLSAVRWAEEQAIDSVVGADEFDEDDLYETLDWLAENQEKIEKRLFAARYKNNTPSLFLYDVTSSYFEGESNDLAEYGYNRDGKSGRKQIVVGLLADESGDPVAIRVFRGNTCDQRTVGEQVKTLVESFGIRNVTLVGDRGMLKNPQIEALPEGFRYITAITKAQTRTLLERGVLQYELFDDKVCEVSADGVRYVFRRNPWRARELGGNRADKLASLKSFVEKRNAYLASHPRSSVDVSVRQAVEKAAQLRISGWAKVEFSGRELRVVADESALESESSLDGCYVIKSDVPAESATAETIHGRYKDLYLIERDFRTMKTESLEVRPVFVRKESRTRGHVFVCMLALLLQRQMERQLREALGNDAPPLSEALRSLDRISVYEHDFAGVRVHRIPEPGARQQEYLSAFGVELPSRLVSPRM